MRNYKLADNTMQHNGITLYQIEAIKDFNGIEKGTLGGYIQSTDNLADNAWVGDSAKVFGDAKVFDDARVYGDAWVGDNAKVFDDARVYGDAWVGDNAKVFDNAQVFDNTKVFDNAQVFDNAKVFGDAWVGDDARVYGDAWVGDNAKVLDNAKVFGDALVYGYAKVLDNAIATRRVFNINSVYNLTMTNNHIRYACIQKTIEEWKQFLDSDEVIETPRESDKFTLIKATLELALLKAKLKI